MSTPNHTPAPWLARIDGPVMASGQMVAEVFHIPNKEAETEANARLIGSAPALLAALREVLPYAENEAEALSEAARRDDDDMTAAEAARAWQAVEAARAALAAAGIA